jgi:hypothetical protein
MITPQEQERNIITNRPINTKIWWAKTQTENATTTPPKNQNSHTKKQQKNNNIQSHNLNVGTILVNRAEATPKTLYPRLNYSCLNYYTSKSNVTTHLNNTTSNNKMTSNLILNYHDQTSSLVPINRRTGLNFPRLTCQTSDTWVVPQELEVDLQTLE